MSETRIEMADGDAFAPREWLRRELLWVLIKVPRKAQIETILDYSAWFVYSGNLIRVDNYSKEETVNLQSLAFFNKGKTIAAFLNWSSLFSLMAHGSAEAATMSQNLKSHARVVDKALGASAMSGISLPSDKDVYEESRNAIIETKLRPNKFGNKQKLIRASKQMLKLGASELAAWISDSTQNEDGSLPTLTIENGGKPRSAKNEFIANLELIFNEAVASDEYLALS